MAFSEDERGGRGAEASGGSGASGATGDDAGSGSDTGGRSGDGGADSDTGGSSWTPPALCTGIPVSERAEFLTEEDGSCVGVRLETEDDPVNIFIMMDRSESMTYESEEFGVRWEGIRNAVQSFVEHEKAEKLSVGLGFFSISGGSDEDVDCKVSNYAEPVVAIGPTPDAGPAMVSAIEETIPSGHTPTLPALRGAISYAREYSEDHPERDTVVVLVTDGYPTLCFGEDPISEIADAAAEGFTDEPSVRTFVVGLEAGFNLDYIAKSGGTGEAYLIDKEDDVAAAFLSRMLTLTSSAMACKFTLPPPDSVSHVMDSEEIAVTFEPNFGQAVEIPRVSNEAGCDLSEYGGWYYDDSGDRPRVNLCPCNCGNVGGGTVTVSAGCLPLTILK